MTREENIGLFVNVDHLPIFGMSGSLFAEVKLF